SKAQAVTGYQPYGAGARVAMTAYNLMFYPWKLVWSAELSPLHELPGSVNPLSWRFLLPTLAFVVVTVVLVAARRRWPGGLAACAGSAARTRGGGPVPPRHHAPPRSRVRLPWSRRGAGCPAPRRRSRARVSRLRGARPEGGDRPRRPGPAPAGPAPLR